MSIIKIERSNGFTLALKVPRFAKENEMAVELLSLEKNNSIAQVCVGERVVKEYIKRGTEYFVRRGKVETALSKVLIWRVLNR
jgi:hypothetical protein